MDEQEQVAMVQESGGITILCWICGARAPEEAPPLEQAEWRCPQCSVLTKEALIGLLKAKQARFAWVRQTGEASDG